MLGEAITKDPGYIKLRKLKASAQIASVISQSQNRVYLDGQSLMLNVTDQDYEIREIKKGQ
jgi:prohibitin 2